MGSVHATTQGSFILQASRGLRFLVELMRAVAVGAWPQLDVGIANPDQIDYLSPDTKSIV
jgi:hypothetical protein